jgi:hypothetical protein
VNPYETDKIAKQRTSEIRAAAGQRRPATARQSIRHRTGWALIKLGLTVMPTAKGGPGFVPSRPRLSGPHLAP